METVSDIHVELAKIQSEIRTHLGLPENALIFDFSINEGKVKLDLITVNPRHNQSFLFHSVLGTDKIDALNKIFKYVKSYKEKENSYTIQWAARNENELHTSYFSAQNMYDALDKLYFGREINTIVVYNISLSPIS